MRTDASLERVRVSSLSDLDAMVGEFLMAETPRTHWEDAHSKLLFDSVEEAMAAFDDPYLRQFVQGESVAATVLTEVKEFRRYSADFEAVWDLIDRVSQRFGALRVCREGARWSATFGQRRGEVAVTAPVAICLAALSAHGVLVENALEAPQPFPEEPRVCADIAVLSSESFPQSYPTYSKS